MTLPLALALAAAVFPAGPAISSQPTAVAARTVGVSIGDDFFTPTRMEIGKGTRVRWTWKGSNPHNVTVTKGPSKFASSTRRKGTYTHTFKKAGTYRIVCTIHEMSMRVKVDS